MRVGGYVYGLATAGAGILDLIWGEFEPAHQPIQAFGDHIPGQPMLAYIAAVWLIAAGAAILWRQSAGAGAVAAAVVYSIFAIFWLPRLYTAPHVLGFRINVFIGVLGGVAQQLILVAAAAIIYASLAMPGSPWPQTSARVARWTFGLSSVNFGLAHLTEMKHVAVMIPKWLPPGGTFWTVLTGIAFVLAGIAILSGILDVLAARLLTLMLLVFSVLVLAPPVFVIPRDHVAWGSNAYNLAAVASVWIFADSIASLHAQREHAVVVPPAGISSGLSR